MDNVIQYRAKRAAVVGGVYRRAGDVFTSAKMDEVPSHLEVLAEPASEENAEEAQASAAKAKAVRKQTVKDEAQVTIADLGIVTTPVS